MQNIEQLGRELRQRGKTDAIKALAETEESRRLAGMLDRGALEQAAKSGDSEALRALLGSVLRTEEGRHLAESVRRLMREEGK